MKNKILPSHNKHQFYPSDPSTSLPDSQSNHQLDYPLTNLTTLDDPSYTYYEAILSHAHSISISTNHPHQITFIKVKICQVLTLSAWKFSSYTYSYWEYMTAWTNILFRQNRYQKVPWIFILKITRSYLFPNGGLIGGKSLVIYLTFFLLNHKVIISSIRLKPFALDWFIPSFIITESLNSLTPSQHSLQILNSPTSLSRSDGGIHFKFPISAYQFYCS